eukprot:4598119-Pleurochrysis_carterae.AAC.1
MRWRWATRRDRRRGACQAPVGRGERGGFGVRLNSRYMSSSVTPSLSSNLPFSIASMNPRTINSDLGLRLRTCGGGAGAGVSAGAGA